MTITNNQIYIYYQQLQEALVNETRALPAKVYFYILKNRQKLEEIVKSIEESKLYIINKYNIQFDDSGNIISDENSAEMANKELQELSSLIQEIDLATISLHDIENLDFTPQQMQALMFMIEE